MNAVGKDKSKGRLIVTDSGLGVGTEDGSDEKPVIGNGDVLEFLFPFGARTVITRVELSEFDEGDAGVLEWSDKQAFDAARKRQSSGSMELLSADVDTSGATQPGHTLYRITATGESQFGLRSLSVQAGSENPVVSAPTGSEDAFPLLYLILIVVGGVCCCIVIGVAVVLLVRSRGDSGDVHDGALYTGGGGAADGPMYNTLDIGPGDANDPLYQSARVDAGFASSEGSNYQALQPTPMAGGYVSPDSSATGTYSSPRLDGAYVGVPIDNPNERYDNLSLKQDTYDQMEFAGDDRYVPLQPHGGGGF